MDAEFVYQLIYEVYSNNVLYSIMAVLVIVTCSVWLLKQFVLVSIKLWKVYKSIEKDSE